MAFRSEEIFFSPTAKCNLACVHCNTPRSNTSLSLKFAEKFLIDCKKHGVKRVGFTGGEPFLRTDLMCPLVRLAVKNGFLFSRIVTNGVWYKNKRGLKSALVRLFNAGYDGSICVSVDAYHKQDLRKLAGFIKEARKIWRRPDVVSIVYVTGRDARTKRKLARLAGLLGARLSGFGFSHPRIASDELFIRIDRIDLSPVGKAARLKDPWDGRWFKEDMCKGPGNVFFVEPSGEVKPCCGYSSESDALSIGNIKRDTVPVILKNIRQNKIVYAIFNLGLSRIRDNLVKSGVKFPGKTSNNCFFCHYILTEVPEKILLASLNR